MRSSRARWLLAALAFWASLPATALASTDGSGGEPPSTASRELGLRLGASGQLERAYSLLRPWAQAHPEDLEAVAAAAFCALRLELFDEAEMLLRGVPIGRASCRERV